MLKILAKLIKSVGVNVWVHDLELFMSKNNHIVRDAGLYTPLLRNYLL